MTRGDYFIVLGLAAVVVGCWQLHSAAGWVAAGAALIVTGLARLRTEAAAPPAGDGT